MHEVTTNQQYDSIVSGHRKVVFKFGAKWCGPCKQVQRPLEELANSRPDVKFCTVDVDAGAEIEDNAEVGTLPTFLVYVDGSPRAKIVGTNLKVLDDELKKY